MFGLGARNSMSLQKRTDSPWYASSSLRLNNVMPSLVHQYDRNRYYNSADKQTAFPFTATRAGNATQFDSQGRLVWASANMLANGGGAGGTASALPTGWTASVGGVPGGTVTVVGQRISDGVIYTRVRFQGTNDATVRYPYLSTVVGGSAPTASVGDNLTGSFVAALIDDPLSNLTSHAPRIELQDLLAAGSYITSGSLNISGSLTSTPTRFSYARVVSGASTGRFNVNFGITILAGASFDFTLEIGAFQIERTGVDSPKPYVNTTGTAKYCARLDYNPATLAPMGLLVEGSRTNSVINSAMVGGVAPSTAPTGWNITAVAGITTAYAYGTEDGIPYIDITWSGSNTSGAAAFPTVFLGTNSSSVAAANGQTWTASCYFRKIAGTSAITSWNHNVRGRASGSLVAGQNLSASITDSAKIITNRQVRQFTFTDATITHVEHVFSISLAISQALDITVRIGGAQLELSECVTSLIPTFGVTATRTAEVFNQTITSIYTPENVVYIEYESHGLTGISPMAYSLDDGTTNNRIYNVGSSVNQSTANAVAGLEVGTVSVSVPNSSGVFRKVARRNKTNDFFISADGVAGSTDLSGATTTGVTTLRIGGSASGASTAILNGHVKQYRIYNDASASNAQLQTLTT